jgi:hypothetical protein
MAMRRDTTAAAVAVPRAMGAAIRSPVDNRKLFSKTMRVGWKGLALLSGLVAVNGEGPRSSNGACWNFHRESKRPHPIALQNVAVALTFLAPA